MLLDVLRFHGVAGIKTAWDAAPEAVSSAAEWFFPTLERFAWGASSLAESYIIEGVDFLPRQIAQLSAKFPLRVVFLGCEQMTPDHFDRFPGRSRGYAMFPEEMRRRFARDIPAWSRFIRQEAEIFSLPYVDTSGDFHTRMDEAERILTSGVS